MLNGPFQRPSLRGGGTELLVDRVAALSGSDLNFRAAYFKKQDLRVILEEMADSKISPLLHPPARTDAPNTASVSDPSFPSNHQPSSPELEPAGFYFNPEQGTEVETQCNAAWPGPGSCGVTTSVQAQDSGPSLLPKGVWPG